jgi:hypothetical protein
MIQPYLLYCYGSEKVTQTSVVRDTAQEFHEILSSSFYVIYIIQWIPFVPCIRSTLYREHLTSNWTLLGPVCCVLCAVYVECRGDPRSII